MNKNNRPWKKEKKGGDETIDNSSNMSSGLPCLSIQLFVILKNYCTLNEYCSTYQNKITLKMLSFIIYISNKSFIKVYILFK